MKGKGGLLYLKSEVVPALLQKKGGERIIRRFPLSREIVLFRGEKPRVSKKRRLTVLSGLIEPGKMPLSLGRRKRYCLRRCWGKKEAYVAV